MGPTVAAIVTTFMVYAAHWQHRVQDIMLRANSPNTGAAPVAAAAPLADANMFDDLSEQDCDNGVDLCVAATSALAVDDTGRHRGHVSSDESACSVSV